MIIKRLVKKRLAFSLLLLFLQLYAIPYTLFPISAADSTPSAAIKSELEELKKEIASKAAKFKQEINQRLQNKAYTGKITQKSDQTLTLAIKSGLRMVNINQDTEFKSKLKTKSKASFKGLAEGDAIVALGDIDESEVLTARQIITISQIPEAKKHIWGQILSISDNIVTVKDRDSKSLGLSTDSDTGISEKLKVNDFVIATGQLNDKGVLETSFIYIIPQGGFIKPKGKIATPSAKPSSKSTKVY